MLTDFSDFLRSSGDLVGVFELTRRRMRSNSLPNQRNRTEKDRRASLFLLKH